MASSVFPTEIDSFATHYDPPSSVMPQVARYQTLMAKSDKTPSEQEEFEDLAEALAPYIFTTEELNTMQDAMVNLEVYFRDNTIDQLDEWNAEITQKINDAQVEVDEWIDERVEKYRYKGEWDKGTTYYEENVVRYQNSLFILKVESCTGTAPTGLSDDPNWELYMPNQKGDKGDKGDPGLNLLFRGQWQASTEYALNDMATYGNQLFACTEAHTSGDAFDSTKWVSVIDSNNIDLEAAAMKMGYFYRCSMSDEETGNTVLTEKIITSMDTSDPLNTENDGTTVLSCVSTMTSTDTEDTIRSVYTDTLDLLGFGAEFVFITKLSGGNAVTYREVIVIDDPFEY